MVRVPAAVGSVGGGGRNVSFEGVGMAIVYDREAPEPFTALTVPLAQVLSASPVYKDGRLTGVLISSLDGGYTGTAYVDYFNSQGGLVGARSITEFMTDETSRTAQIDVERRSGASDVVVNLPGLRAQKFPMREPRR